MTAQGIDHDDFLFRLIEAGHTAIFQWIAVYIASGIGLIQIIIELLNSPKISYQLIYLVLIGLMTGWVLIIFSVMNNQNKWAKELSNENQKKLFYESRTRFSQIIVDKSTSISKREIAALVLHMLLLLLVFIIVLWLSDCVVS